MEILKFKTNIGSQEALAKVGPVLDGEKSISKWNVDTDGTDHLLSISGVDVDPQRVENAVQQAGYKAELIRVLGIGGHDL